MGDCCKKWKRKSKVCKSCPLVRGLSKKKRKKKIRKLVA